MRIAGIISFAVLTVLLARVKCDEEDITVTAENLTQGVRHACAHDWIVRHSHAKHVTAHQQYEDTGPGKSRRLTSAAWAPIRIVPIYTQITSSPNMTASLASYLQDQLVPAAVNYWQQTLAVLPVSGALVAHRQCNAYSTLPPYSCSNYASQTGCSNGLSPQDLNIYFNSTLLTTGIDADMVLFVTAVQTSLCGSSGGDGGSASGTLAYTVTCQRDQYDRPTFSRINFCPDALDDTPAAWDAQLAVAKHELAHGLGFSASSWPLFRSNTSAPMTPRNSRQPNQVASAYTISYTCQGSSYQTAIPAQNTVLYVNERGMSCSYPNGVVPSSNCVAKIVTPRVASAAQDFFACPTLVGAELENQLTSPCDAQGSHWEQRIFNGELMGSYLQHVAKVSAVTLAVFEDSSWYKANYSMADFFQPNRDFGYGQGCNFATQKCLQPATSSVVGAMPVGQGTPPHYVAATTDVSAGTGVCTTDHLAIGYTQLGYYTSALPSQYEYFGSQPTLGGTNPSTFDYCPAITAYSNGDCRIEANTFSQASYHGAAWGPSSLCIASTLTWTNVHAADGSSNGIGLGANCYTAYCSGNTTLVISVGPGYNAASGTTLRCNAGDAGTQHTVAGYQGSITCPDPAAICGSAYQYNPDTHGSNQAPTGYGPDDGGDNQPPPSAAHTPEVWGILAAVTFIVASVRF